MKRLKDLQGFTLIELVMIIVILAILAVVAVPKFFDLSGDANTSAEKGVVGGVRAGIQTYLAKNKFLPTDLDTTAVDGACTAANVCFDEVLSQGGITADWTKAGNAYTRTGGGTYTYVPATGSFN